jgi:anti-anti-sigma factor
VKRKLLKDRETFHLEIPADENNLSEVRDFIAEICLSAGFSKRETNNTKLAMDEACTNIIKHAYGGTGGDIRIDVQAEPGTVEINIFDRGTPFDWSGVEDPDLEQYVEIGKKGGLGIFLMNRLMDDLDYQASEAGNRLFMAKHVETAAMERGPAFIPLKRRWTSTLRFKFGLRAALGLLGLVTFLWIFQYMNQTQDIEIQRRQAWVGMSNLARVLESKSEDALVIDDLYDPEYRKLTDLIAERLDKAREVRYARIVNGEGLVVASSILDEFQEPYDVPSGFTDIDAAGEWRSVPGADGGMIKEFHLPVVLSGGEGERTVRLGRVVMGVSEEMVVAGINDPRFKTTIILIGIFIVGVSLIYLLISVLVKPIQALTDGVRAIGEGSLEDEIRIDGPEEIGAIARAFNEITSKFREAQKSVVEQERIQKEMQVAQEIQHTLLPKKVPKISGYDIASLYRAAKEVGGDYYDFINVDENTVGVVVADVSGKGVPGSLVMTIIRTSLRMEARGSLSAGDVMARMNDFVTEDMKKGMFVTIFYVILDSKNRIISYASAGHNPMILYRAESDETFFLNPRGFPVGISLPDSNLFRRSIDVEKIKLKKDDMLVIYTDGVTEAMNADRNQYGEERLIRLIKRHGRLAPQDFIDRLNKDIKEFTGDYPQNDDITVVAIKEKLMADDVLFGIRKKLIDLVEVEGMTVAAACKMMKVSPSTFYRYKRRLMEMGERGLKNKTLREAHEIRRVSLEQRKRIFEIVRENPSFGAKRISTVFNEGRDEKDRLTPSLIYDELKRMRLNTYEKRLEYLRRNRFITEDEFQAMVAAPGGASPPKRAEAPGVTPAAEQPPEGAPDEVEPVHEEIPAAAELPPALEPAAAARELATIGMETEKAGIIQIQSREIEGGVVVLEVEGHLDSSSAAELEGILESVHEYGYRKIIVDLESVSYISSGGWGIFTGRVKTLREEEGDVVLAGMSPEVYDIYELLGFADIIMHYQTVDEAVEFIGMSFDERRMRLEEVRRVVRAEPAPAAEYAAVAEDDDETSPWTPLKIEAGTVGASGEITVINLDGVIDAVSSMRLRSVLEELIAQGATRLVVDMSRIEYVSSSGWGVFASRIDEIRKRGGDIKIFGMDPEVDGIFHLLGFDTIMRSFQILAEAIGDFEEAAAATPGIGGDPGRVTEEEADGGGEPIEDESEQPVDFTFEASRIERNGAGSIVLSIGGAIDASTTARFEERIERSANGEKGNVIIDLSNVVYISSSGWGVIVKYMQDLNSRGRILALTGMNPVIFRIFRDLGFEPLIPHYLSIERAGEELAAAGGEPAVEPAVEPADATADEPVVEEAVGRTESGGGTDGGDDAAGAEPASPDVDGMVETPRVVKRGVTPIKPAQREHADERIVHLDFGKKRDVTEEKDKNIRELGWDEYGRKLSERNEQEPDAQ